MARCGRNEDTRPATIDEDQRAEFAELGVSLPAGAGRNEEDVFEIWDINSRSFEAFVALQNQWRVLAGFGFVAHLGLDWSAADLLLRRRSLGDREFEDLLVMEEAALEIFAEEIG